MEEKTLKKIELFLEKWEEKEIFKRIDEFHEERIKKLKKNETPKSFLEGGKLIFHLIPVESFESQKQHDLSIYKDHPQALKPMKFQSYDQTYNFDGMLYFSLGTDNKCLGYVQVYTNGIIEAVDGYFLSSKEKILYILDIERGIIDSTKEYLLFQKKIGVKPPIIFYLALIGSKGFSIKSGSEDIFDGTHPIDREDLKLPKIIIDKFEVDIAQMLKTSFDQIWNACGYPRSKYYDKNDKRKEK